MNRDCPTRKRFKAGTHRIVSPEATIARVDGLRPVMGITRVANVTGLDSIGIPVVMVCRPNSRALAVSQGKGLTLAAARASGLMESIESYHAERIHSPLKLASTNELRYSHPLADVDRLPRPGHSTFHPDAPLLWIEGRELLGGERRWLPFETVHGDFRVPYPTGSGAFHLSSNGLASGNHFLEAVSHGICEVVERDASALWAACDDARQQRTRVDLDSVDDPDCRHILQRYERAGVAVGVWETTTDVGLPSFDCTIVERDPDLLRPLPPAFGAGCHPAREIALLRALTEAAQSRLTAISGSRDDMDRFGFERSRAVDTVSSVSALITAAGKQRRSFREAPTFDGESFERDLEWLLERLRDAGIEEVIAVDLTKSELGVPVVKIVISGLEAPHTVAGYVPGPRARAAARGGLPRR